MKVLKNRASVLQSLIPAHLMLCCAGGCSRYVPGVFQVCSRYVPGMFQVCQLLNPDQVVLNISQTDTLLLNCLEPLDQRGSSAPAGSLLTPGSSSSAFIPEPAHLERNEAPTGRAGGGRGYLSGQVGLGEDSPAAPV